MVLIPGLPGSARDWRYLGPQLRGRRALRLELPGLGCTPLSAGPALDLPGRAAWVARAIEVLDLHDVVLVGHSMGGPVAGLAADLLPGRVSALALVCSVGVSPHPALRPPGPQRAARLIDAPVVGPLARRALPGAFRRVGFPPVWPVDVLAHSLRVAAAFDFAPWRAALARLRLPTLVAWTADDPLVLPEYGEALARATPDGPRLTFPTGGHNPQKHHAEALARALLELPPARRA